MKCPHGKTRLYCKECFKAWEKEYMEKFIKESEEERGEV